MSVWVRRGNKMLQITDDAVQRYLTEGYDVVDERGAVIQKAVPRDATTLTLEYHRLTAENDKLKEAINVLNTKIAELTAENNSLKAVEVKSETPKRTRKKTTETETVEE